MERVIYTRYLQVRYDKAVRQTDTVGAFSFLCGQTKEKAKQDLVRPVSKSQREAVKGCLSY